MLLFDTRMVYVATPGRCGPYQTLGWLSSGFPAFLEYTPHADREGKRPASGSGLAVGYEQRAMPTVGECDVLPAEAITLIRSHSGIGQYSCNRCQGIRCGSEVLAFFLGRDYALPMPFTAQQPDLGHYWNHSPFDCQFQHTPQDSQRSIYRSNF